MPDPHKCTTIKLYKLQPNIIFTVYNLVRPSPTFSNSNSNTNRWWDQWLKMLIYCMTPTIETLRDTCSPKSKPSIAKIKSITSTCLITQVPNKRKEIWRRNKKFSWMRGACNLDSRWPTSNVCNKMTWLRAIKEFCKARCSSRKWLAPKRIKRKLKCNKCLYIRLSSLEIKSSKCAWLGRGSNKSIETF